MQFHKTVRGCVNMLINVKMPTIVGILTFMSMINSMLANQGSSQNYFKNTTQI